MNWNPHVTVATLVEEQGKFLLVEEVDEEVNKHVFNQPAGHLEDNESLIEAAVRETLEETGWLVEVTALLGIYHYRSKAGTTYIRHCFIATPLQHFPDQTLDEGIIAAHWLGLDEIMDEDFPVRSISVRQVINDYINGQTFPLSTHFYQQEDQHA